MEKSYVCAVQKINGKILVVERKGETGLVRLPGGEVKSDESPLISIQRNILKETGYFIVTNRLEKIYSNINHEGNIVIAYQSIMKQKLVVDEWTGPGSARVKLVDWDILCSPDRCQSYEYNTALRKILNE